MRMLVLLSVLLCGAVLGAQSSSKPWPSLPLLQPANAAQLLLGTNGTPEFRLLAETFPLDKSGQFRPTLVAYSMFVWTETLVGALGSLVATVQREQGRRHEIFDQVTVARGQKETAVCLVTFYITDRKSVDWGNRIVSDTFGAVDAECLQEEALCVVGKDLLGRKKECVALATEIRSTLALQPKGGFTGFL
jgi:hypothetical protein